MGQSNCCLYNIRRYRSDGTTYWHRDYAGHKGARLLNLSDESETLLVDTILPSGSRQSGNPICIDSNEDYIAVGGQWISGAEGDPEYYNIAIYNYDGSLKWRGGIETNQSSTEHYGKYNIISICVDVNNNIWACGTRTRSSALEYRLWKFDINGNELDVFNIYASTIRRRSSGGVWYIGTVPSGDLSEFGLNVSSSFGTGGVFYFDENDNLHGIYYDGGPIVNSLASFSFAYTNYPLFSFGSGSPTTLGICESTSTDLITIGSTVVPTSFVPDLSKLSYACIGKVLVENRNTWITDDLLYWAISPKDHWYGYNTNSVANPGDIPGTIPQHDGVSAIHSINSIDNDNSTGIWTTGRYWDESRNAIKLAKINDSTGDIISEFTMEDEFYESPNGNFSNILCLTDSHLILKASFALKENNFTKINTSAEIEYRHKHLVYNSLAGHSSTLDGGHVAASTVAYRIGAGEISFIE